MSNDIFYNPNKDIWISDIRMSEYFFFAENVTISCHKTTIFRWSLSTLRRVNTPRGAFQIERTVGTSLFTQSKTSVLIESTTNDQVPVFDEKIGNYEI